MWLTLDDLRCSECRVFVHPLLDACPTCGAARPSRRQEAAAGPIGAARLIEAPETQHLARDLTLRYTIKVNAIGGSEPDATLIGAVAHLADALTYRITGDAVPTTDNVGLAFRDGNLIAQGRPSGALLAEIPLPAIVGTAAGHGEVMLHYAAGPTAGAASAPAGSPSAAGPLRLTVSNRRGLLASKARDDHFEALARWLGVLAAAAAERRWTEIGLPAYLAELGAAAGGPAGSPAVTGDLSPRTDNPTPAGAGGTPALAVPGTPSLAASPSSIQATLVELEALRAAGLVAEDEYAEKRREILARL
jgi:hypothetical protein